MTVVRHSQLSERLLAEKTVSRERENERLLAEKTVSGERERLPSC